MALISVVELMFDPDFVEPVTVVRMLESVGDDGIAVHVEERHDVLASIQSSSESLSLLPDGARTSSTYEIHTAFQLQVATETTSADTVLWRGMTFVVTAIGRFGNWSGTTGHFEGVMEMQPVRTTVGPP